MASYTYSEYHDVVRVNADTEAPQSGYRYFAEKEHSLPSLQYAREMTLARGRILYEVWDIWRSMFVGYIVPTNVYNEAIAWREGPTLAVWSNLRLDHRLVHHQTYRLITERFPRIHPMSARVVTEVALNDYGRWAVPPRAFVEAVVVKHVRDLWSSYQFRLKSSAQTPTEAFKSVKKRMRDILESWLPESILWNNLVEFWEKHDLLEEGENGKEGDIVLLRPSKYGLRWYGGAETNANLVSASALPML